MKAIERVLWFAYGNHSMSSAYRSDAELLLDYLAGSGYVSREELAERTGFGDDVERLKKVLQPLKGDKKSNPLDVSFVHSERVDGQVYYRLSKERFDASIKPLKNEIVEFLDRESIQSSEYAEMEKILRLCFSNHQSTYGFREKAPIVLRSLVNNGEVEKSELMTMIGLEYGSESDDRSFRRMMQYLRGSWSVDDEKKNPLHTDSHSFLVRMDKKGNEAYYSVDTGEFRRSMNVVIKSIRDFLSDDEFLRHQLRF